MLPVVQPNRFSSESAREMGKSTNNGVISLRFPFHLDGEGSVTELNLLIEDIRLRGEITKANYALLEIRKLSMLEAE